MSSLQRELGRATARLYHCNRRGVVWVENKRKASLDLEIDDWSIVVEYHYGLAYKDGTEEPYAWVHLISISGELDHLDGTATVVGSVPREIIDQANELCIKRASEALGVVY